MKGYIDDPISGSFPWTGNLEDLPKKVKEVRGFIHPNTSYWIEEVVQNDEVLKLVIWKEDS